MPKMTKGLVLVLLAALVAGCASTQQGGLSTRAYVVDQDREDQDMSGGNFGYISGTPVQPDRSGVKDTRRVYVLEVTKETEGEESAESLVPPPRPKPERRELPPPAPVAEPEWSKPVALPDFEDVEVEPAPVAVSGACEEYVVQKGDTLQKISKKFYGSYAKWGKVYEANRNILEDPDKLKVGMRICVPGASAPAAEVENLK